MNQTQRNFLIKKIEEAVKGKVKELEDGIPDYPSLSNYLLHAVMSNSFEIKSIQEIKNIILKKALGAKGDQDWLGSSWHMANKSSIIFKAEEIFIIPDEYRKKAEDCKKIEREIKEQIKTMKIQSESLITRIQLASDKTLQKMINEVDDMGDISLIDTKLKYISNG